MTAEPTGKPALQLTDREHRVAQDVIESAFSKRRGRDGRRRILYRQLTREGLYLYLRAAIVRVREEGGDDGK